MNRLFAFIDPSPSYVHGYEAGMVHVDMERTKPEISRGLPYHTANIPQFELMARCYGYDIEERPTEYPEWTYLVFRKRGVPA